MESVLAFWLAALLVATLALPLCFVVFRRFPDAGAGLAFPLGLLLVGYAYFMLRVVRVLPMGRGGYLLVVALVALLAVAVAARDRQFWKTLERVAPLVVAEFALFSACFVGYVLFRSYIPDITGTEQPMDLMYLNATVNSPSYPPEDPWMAGQRASYYYFGYLQVGALTEIGSVPTSEGYNLGLAYTFAAAAAGVLSLAGALARWAAGRARRASARFAGLLAIVLLLALGSIEGVFELFAAHGAFNRSLFARFGLESLASVRLTDSWYPTEFWFWWRGSRVIPGTITEFPFFSFLLGDLHPHVMSIPLVLLAAGCAAAVWRGRSVLDWTTYRRPGTGLVIALVVGGLAFENAWDILTMGTLLAAAATARNLRRLPARAALAATVRHVVPAVVVAVVLYAPWWFDFRSQAGGLYPYVGVGTRPEHAFLQWGPLLAGGLLVLWLSGAVIRRRVDARLAWWAAAVPAAPLAVWLVLADYHGTVNGGFEERGPGGWVTLAFLGIEVWGLVVAAACLHRARSAMAAVAGLAAIAVLLLYGSEILFIRDVFFNGVPRLNTVFKLSYQAWILLAVVGAVAVTLTPSWSFFRQGAGILIVAGLVYAATALPNRTGGFADPQDTIDGFNGLARSDPAEYALTRWVQDNIAPGERIIEASGRAWRRDGSAGSSIYEAGVDYTDAGRIAARTGRPSLIGWYFHEVQWRGDTPANRVELTRRQNLVDSVYLAKSPADALAAMREAGARYVVYGSVERSRFPAELLPPFDSFLDVVFRSGDLRVYRLPEYAVVPTT